MTKLQTWNAAQDLLKELGLFSNPIVVSKFEELLAPKKGGGLSRPEPIFHNDENHYFCRFTGLYFPASEMVYQNPDKRAKLEDKGYSNIGSSIWNKAQKHIKDLPTKSIEIRYGEDQSDGALAKAIKLDQEFMEIKKDNLGNNAEYLMSNFLSESQADALESLDLPNSAVIKHEMSLN